MNICSTSISYKYDSKLKSNALHFFNVGDEPTKGKLPLSSTKEAGRFPLPIKFAMSFISENSYLLSIFTFFFFFKKFFFFFFFFFFFSRCVFFFFNFPRVKIFKFSTKGGGFFFFGGL